MEEKDNLIEMLNSAMVAQKRSVRAYEIMSAAANKPKDQEMLRTIQREERRHYYFLEGIYEDLTGTAFIGQKSAISLPKYFNDMLKTAICDKLEIIDHYQLMTGMMNCQRQKELLQLIINDQKQHARLLGSIYQQS